MEHGPNALEALRLDGKIFHFLLVFTYIWLKNTAIIPKVPKDNSRVPGVLRLNGNGNKKQAKKTFF